LSFNTDLTALTCNNNKLTSLDLSSNPDLYYIICVDNLLNSLNVQNGNNVNVLPNFFRTTSNPNLTCIQVDDPVYSSNNWTYIDSISSFSSNCLTGLQSIPEQLEELNVFPNPTTQDLHVDLGISIENVSVEVKNMMGQILFLKTYKETQYIDLEFEYAQGLYLLSIYTKENEVSLNIVKN
jgi:hypothetical protein